MTYTQAVAVVRDQNKSIWKLNGMRFEYGGYEYRLKCECGFTILIDLERRAIGKRNFKYFDCIDATSCYGAQSALERVRRFLETGGKIR